MSSEPVKEQIELCDWQQTVSLEFLLKLLFSSLNVSDLKLCHMKYKAVPTGGSLSEPQSGTSVLYITV